METYALLRGWQAAPNGASFARIPGSHCGLLEAGLSGCSVLQVGFSFLLPLFLWDWMVSFNPCNWLFFLGIVLPLVVF